MIDDSRPSSEQLAEECAKETHQFFHDGKVTTGPNCLQLFQQAIIHKDEGAWEAIYQQFGPLVKGWVLKHPAFSKTGEAADYFVNMAFMRLWGAMTPEKCMNFDDIKGILSYLQTCTHSAIIDQWRSRQKELLDIDTQDVQYRIETKRELISQQIHQALYCKQVLDAAVLRLKNDKERLVFHEIYVLGMKPNDIYQQHAEEFESVKEIYRIKENILARLRRDKELQQMMA